MSCSKNYIDGQWVAPIAGNYRAVIDPSTGRSYAEIPDSGAGDVDLAVAAARKAFDEGEWGGSTAVERGRLLFKFSELVRVNANELAAIEARDTGKPLSVAAADIIALERYFEFYGGAADKFHGEVIPYLDGHHVAVLNEPHGVTGHILPWNYPAQMFGRSLAPALAVGNAVVLKPAEDASASALRLAELAGEAGFPAGAINVVTGCGETAGAALASHPGVDFVSFTGSPRVGQIIQKLCADHYINCTLELGGKSPHLVFEDVDFDAAIPVIVKAITQNSGQTCSAGTRLLIQRSIQETFLEKLAEAFKKVRVGTPDMDVECGPIVTANQKDKVDEYLQLARQDGIEVIAEGSRVPGTDPDGFYVTPTLLGPVPRDHALAREEIFGPVLSVLPFDDEEDAIQLANDTEYGLVAAVWTQNGGRQMRMMKRIRAGQVFINCYGAGAGIELPFGGSGKSGHGREKGFAALHDFSKTKTMVLNHG